MTQTHYILTRTCEIGNSGDIIRVNPDVHNGGLWTNLRTGEFGTPFLEEDQARRMTANELAILLGIQAHTCEGMF